MTITKGVILAGGMGKRLAPLTTHDNKHFLPVYDRRMIEYPLMTLVNMGIKDIIIVLGGLHAGKFVDLLKDGSDYGCRIGYTYQQGYGGIPTALQCAEPFLGDGPFVAILGDNYFEGPLQLPNFVSKGYCCGVYLQATDEPYHFGIAEVGHKGRIVHLEEKPTDPRSNLAILGCYVFPGDVWRVLRNLKPSSRGETEIIDVLDHYMNQGRLEYTMYEDYWSDMGTFTSWSKVGTRAYANNRQLG